MEAKKLDQLFKNKVGKAKSEPNHTSWDQLESMLDAKEEKTPKVIWRIAASIVLLLASVVALQLFILDEDLNDQAIARIEMQPLMPLSPGTTLTGEIDISMMQVDIKESNEIIIAPIEAQETDVLVAEAVSTEVIEQIPEEEELFIDVFSDEEFEALLASIEIEEEAAPLPNKNQNQIKITYKRTPTTDVNELMATADQDSTKKGSLKKLWQKSKEIEPANLWADLRDAKDNLFVRNEKKKNKKNVKNFK